MKSWRKLPGTLWATPGLLRDSLFFSFLFEKHKQSSLSENYEDTFPNKQREQSNAHEKHKQFFPNENYNRTRHAHALATSDDSIPPRLL
jgi:hypothetical protein